METRAWRLRLHSPLHVGDQGIGSEVTHAYVPSDTLFSALAVTWRALAGLPPLAELLDEHNPPLLLSSAFPFAGDVLLLPKPLLPFVPQPPQKGQEGQEDQAEQGARTAEPPQPDQPAQPDQPEAESPKRFRRVRWVSHSLFAALLAAPAQATVDTLWRAGKTVQGGSVWVTADESSALQTLVDAADDDVRLWSTGIIPRVTVDRVSNASQIHQTGRASFAPGCGLWFLARAEAHWLDALGKVLAVLGDEGMGGKRSVGSGQFTPEPLTPPALAPAGGDCAVLLSRTAPQQGQMKLLRHPQAAYELVLVGGFSGTPGDSPLVRRQVRMLAEGSIVGAPPAGAMLGQLVDVTPEEAPSVGHKILRSGLGFPVPVQLPAGENAAGEDAP